MDLLIVVNFAVDFRATAVLPTSDRLDVHPEPGWRTPWECHGNSQFLHQGYMGSDVLPGRRLKRLAGVLVPMTRMLHRCRCQRVQRNGRHPRCHASAFCQAPVGSGPPAWLRRFATPCVRMFASMVEVEIHPMDRFATEDRVVVECMVTLRITGNGVAGAPVQFGARRASAAA